MLPARLPQRLAWLAAFVDVGAPVVDLEVLHVLAAELDSVDVVVAIVSAYLEDLDVRLDALRSALCDDSDPVDLYRAAHTLRSPSSLVGASGLVEICRQVESWARRDGTDRDLGPGARAGIADALDALAAETRCGLQDYLGGHLHQAIEAVPAS